MQINSVNLYKGLNVGSLEVGETLIIEYKVKVNNTNCHHKIENIANAKFSYVLPDNRGGVKGFSSTEATSSIEAKISTFNQMSVEEELQILVAKPDIESINGVTGTIDIISCRLIETAALISQENQRLTGYKLVVTEMLNIVIKYTSLEAEQSVHLAHL